MDGNQIDSVGEHWRAQPRASRSPALAEVQIAARRFERTIRWRNRREYIAGLVVLVFFGWHAFTAVEPVERLGHLLIVAATLWVVARLIHSGRVAPPPAGSLSCLEAHRAELVHQRDLLRSVWAWYVLPFAPGLGVLLGNQVVLYPASALRVGLYATFCVGLGIGVAWLNRYVASTLDRDIAELDQLALDPTTEEPTS